MATVLGSAREAYQCSVVATAGPTSLVATCTCPVRRDCKHSAALLLAARRSAGRRGPASWGARATWRLAAPTASLKRRWSANRFTRRAKASPASAVRPAEAAASAS